MFSEGRDGNLVFCTVYGQSARVSYVNTRTLAVSIEEGQRQLRQTGIELEFPLIAAERSVSLSPLRGWHHSNMVSCVRLLTFRQGEEIQLTLICPLPWSVCIGRDLCQTQSFLIAGGRR